MSTLRRRRGHVGVLAAVMALLATGCATDALSPPPGTPAPSTPTSGPVGVVEEDQARLLLWVSNQSFVDDPVRVTVHIDGVPVVDEDFAVEGQHNWVRFPVDLPPGEHELVAESDTGVQLTRTFTLPVKGPRYAVMDYWNYPGEGRRFTWRIQKNPFAFD